MQAAYMVRASDSSLRVTGEDCMVEGAPELNPADESWYFC